MSAPNDIREFLDILEKQSELIRIRTEVDAKYELGAFIRHEEEEGLNRAVLFERVKGYNMPVVANLYGTVRRISIGLGILDPSPEDVDRYRRDPRGGPGGMGGGSVEGYTLTDDDRARNILAEKRIWEAERQVQQGVRATTLIETGPCKEVIIMDSIDLLRELPVPWFCANDGGPYINPACLVQRDPDTGILNIGVHRHHVSSGAHGPRRMGALISDFTDGFQILRKYEERNQPCPVALCIGPDPATEIMGNFMSPNYIWDPPYSEFDVAGILLGRPLEMVKCETVDLEVPANTEIVVEGFIPPKERLPEGPMAEFTDYSGSPMLLPYIEVTAITRRKDAVMQALMSGASREHLTLGLPTFWGIERTTLIRIRRTFPTVKDLAIFPGSRMFHLVVSFKMRMEGEDKLLLHHLIATTHFKYITIVDDDIDPRDFERVEWARATRAGRNQDDFMVFPRTRCYGLDPEGDEHRMVTRLGILATLPFGQTYEKSGPPQEIIDRTRGIFREQALPYKQYEA